MENLQNAVKPSNTSSSSDAQYNPEISFEKKPVKLAKNLLKDEISLISHENHEKTFGGKFDDTGRMGTPVERNMRKSKK